MMLVLVFITYLLGITPSILSSEVAPQNVAKPNCPEKCGTVSIPFPFGIGSNCSIDKWFEIECDNSTASHRPYLKHSKLDVLNISVDDRSDRRQQLLVRSPISFLDCAGKEAGEALNLTGTPFRFTNNIFVAVSCNSFATLDSSFGDMRSETGCRSVCSSDNRTARSCDDSINCCEARIPSIPDTYKISFDQGNSSVRDNDDNCRFAFLVDWNFWEAYKNRSASFSQIRDREWVPVTLGWQLNYSYFDIFKTNMLNKKTTDCYNPSVEYSDPSYDTGPPLQCRCIGLRGNPYLINGCNIDINECEEYRKEYPEGLCGRGGTCVNTFGGFHCSYKRRFILIGFGSALGALVLLFGTWGLYKLIKKRKETKRKKKFFKQNGGLLLQQQVSSDDGNIKKTKLYSSDELTKATGNFSIERVLGQGGQGTVYKGMLEDGKIVAIKKSKVVDEEKLSEFINEVVILSQINHRNVVQLLGCCLETEVPLLVYEFIPNGTLCQYLHERNEEFPFTWKRRLQVATEIAGALSYLHSAASFPIYHRDIKSTNILLDEKYRAKVADFGTSRSISVEQSHLTTIVYGTFGYLDPEYFQSSQFTDKSDVYSFGVVLVELLTGQKAICETRAAEGRNLATYFIVNRGRQTV